MPVITSKFLRFCAKYERWKVVSFKDGCIFKTKKIGFAWFIWGKGPDTNKLDSNNEFWCPTLITENRHTYETVNT